MAEPLPSTITEGSSTASAPPASSGTDSANATAALTDLDSTATAAVESKASGKNGNAGVLNDAISKLSVNDDANKASATAAAEEAKRKREADEAERKRKAAIKVDPAHVAVVVESIGLNKVAATELLREHEGQLGKTLRAWVKLGATQNGSGSQLGGSGLDREWIGGSSMSRPVRV